MPYITQDHTIANLDSVKRPMKITERGQEFMDRRCLQMRRNWTTLNSMKRTVYSLNKPCCSKSSVRCAENVTGTSVWHLQRKTMNIKELWESKPWSEMHQWNILMRFSTSLYLSKIEKPTCRASAKALAPSSSMSLPFRFRCFNAVVSYNQCDHMIKHNKTCNLM